VRDMDMSVERKVKLYILENFLFTNDEAALSSDVSFQKKGLLDSTGILEVITFIEDEFGIKVEEHEMIPENMDSINKIVRFVEAKNKFA
jgi:acyl carrier protein